MTTTVVTNNPLVRDMVADQCPVDFCHAGCRDVLVRIRDYVHAGSILLTHPLYGSVKPGETPLRSVALCVKDGPVNMKSLEMIEAAIAACDTCFQADAARWETYGDEFAIVDKALFESALGPLGLEAKGAKRREG